MVRIYYITFGVKSLEYAWANVFVKLIPAFCVNPLAWYHPGFEAVNGTIRKLLQLENPYFTHITSLMMCCGDKLGHPMDVPGFGLKSSFKFFATPCSSTLVSLVSIYSR